MIIRHENITFIGKLYQFSKLGKRKPAAYIPPKKDAKAILLYTTLIPANRADAQSIRKSITKLIIKLRSAYTLWPPILSPNSNLLRELLSAGYDRITIAGANFTLLNSYASQQI